MNDNDRNKVQRLIAIYQNRVDNSTGEMQKRYKEFLSDLNHLITARPSKDIPNYYND